MTALIQTEVLKGEYTKSFITFIKMWKKKTIKTRAANLLLAKGQTLADLKIRKMETNIMSLFSHYLLYICCHYAITQIERIKSKRSAHEA